MGSCSGCDTTWSGEKICHCSVCHRSFSVEQHFKVHREPLKKRGNTHKGDMSRCVDPKKLLTKDKLPLLKLNRHGVWVGNTERPDGSE